MSKLEEAIKRLKKDIKKPLYCGDITIVNIDDLETILQALENSIPKQIIEDIINKNIRKDTILGHEGYVYDFDGCQQITKEITKLLKGK